MARPRKRSRATLSLFPFLSVLACIIGTLTLLITATAIGEIGPGAIDLDAYEALEREIDAGRRELAALRALEEEVASLAAAIAEEEDARATLAEERARHGAASEESAPLGDELDATGRRVAALEEELAAAGGERDGLAAQLDGRREALARAPIGIEPSGSGSGLDPHFVECRGDGVVLYEGPERRPVRVPTARLAHSLDVRSFLRRVRATRGASAILLVRPSGIAACRAMSVEAGHHGARNGSMPIPEEGELDFSSVRAGAQNALGADRGGPESTR